MHSGILRQVLGCGNVRRGATALTMPRPSVGGTIPLSSIPLSSSPIPVLRPAVRFRSRGSALSDLYRACPERLALNELVLSGVEVAVKPAA
ncbi:MAG: hypothetical protein V7K48_29690 [Nostoc sp.]